MSADRDQAAATNCGNTLEGRLAADRDYPHGRIGVNPDPDGCLAILKLGSLWARGGISVFCSRRPLPGNAFCGQHDHLNVLIGTSDVDEYLMAALRRAQARGETLRVLRRPE